LHRALAHLALGDLDDALADYANVLKQQPKNSNALYGRGTVRLKKGDAAGGNDDIAAAKAVSQDIDKAFWRYPVKADKR